MLHTQYMYTSREQRIVQVSKLIGLKFPKKIKRQRNEVKTREYVGRSIMKKRIILCSTSEI